MTIEEFIPEINDEYIDTKGRLHTDINLPVSDENNYLLFDKFNSKKAIIPRINAIKNYTEQGWNPIKVYTEINCYLIVIWEKSK